MRAFHRLVAGAWCALAVAIAVPAAAQSPSQREIDAAHSTATFSIQHIFVDRVKGTVPIVSGSVTLAPESLVPVSVSAVLDATKIHTDEPDRDASLESPDYFDTKQFPTWTFASTAIVATGPAAFTMEGILTIHGVAHPEHLSVTVAGDDAHPVYHAVGQIDRRTFGMKGTRLDPVIGTSANVTLDITVR
jgi:polyisoprenoid-binding protein YceI